MSNEESGLATSRRAPRQGVGGSPVGSWLTIVLAVLAVVIGFLILRNITEDADVASPNDQSSQDDSVASDATLVDISVPATDATTTTTTIPRVTEGASIVVANANTVGGSAGNMTKTLEAAGYTLIDPVNATGPNIIDSIVYYDPAQAAAEDVAQSVARDMGGLEVLEVQTPAPTDDGDLGEAGVLVLLGDNEAGKTLEELSPETAVVAPTPSDADVPSTAPADADLGEDAETTTDE